MKDHRPERAAGDFARAFELEPTNTNLARHSAVQLLEAGDVSGYRRACQRIPHTGQPVGASHSSHDWVMALVLRRDSLDDWQPVIAQAEKMRAAEPQHAWIHHALAGVYFRAGRYQDALQALNEADRWSWPASVVNGFLRSIVLARLGRMEDARSELAKAVRWTEQNLPAGPFPQWVGHWWDWYTLVNYRREAESLILYDPVFPANPFAVTR
jgi:tetratricopeptide (TPR) repeat protein